MEKGQLRKEGESVAKEEAVEGDAGGNKEIGDAVVKDSFGNEIKVEKSKTMTDKEKKQAVKKLQKQLKEAKKKGASEETIMDLEDKIEALKA